MSVHRRCLLLAAAGALALAGCAVGPNFEAPHPPLPAGADYGPEPLDGIDRSATTPFGASAIAGPRWWHGFGAPELDALVDESLAGNTDLRAARNALQRARDVVAVEQGLARWPSVDLQVEPARQRALNLPGAEPPTVIYDTYAVLVGASYTFDLFGGEKRTIEGYAADAATRAAELDAARIAVAANVVATAIQSAALQRRIEVAERAEAAASSALEVAQRRRALGRLDDAAVAGAERNRAAQRAALPALRAAHRRTRTALALLLGRTPDRAPPDLDFATLRLPSELPLVVPAQLVERRPDVAAAQARLHAATARYGAAIANLYPQIQLSASWGRESYHAVDLFSGPSAVWRIAASLTQPLFRGGALEAAKRAAGLDRDSALAAYVGTVLQALRSVADAQQTLVEDGVAVAAATDAAAASQRLLEQTRGRERLGGVAPAALFADEQGWLGDEGARVAAEATRLVDAVAYFQALSGADIVGPAAASGVVEIPAGSPMFAE